MVQACQRVVEKTRPIAAHLLECDVGDVEFSDGTFRVRGTPEGGKTLADCALAVFVAHDLPPGVEPDLDAEAVYDPVNFSFPHGTHLCATEVDTETGRVSIRSYVCVDDVGKVVNPLIVEGQIHGGVAQGIAQALYEGVGFDEHGTPLNGNLMAYAMPSAADLPALETFNTVTPTPINPLGAKGIGESATRTATCSPVPSWTTPRRPRLTCRSWWWTGPRHRRWTIRWASRASARPAPSRPHRRS